MYEYGLRIIYNALEYLMVPIFLICIYHIIWNIIKNKKFPSVFLILFTLYGVMVFISSCINGVTLLNSSSNIVRIVSLCYIIEYYANTGRFKNLVNVWFWYYLAIIGINFLTICILPNGINATFYGTTENPLYLVAEDNGQALWNVLFIVLCLLQFRFSENKGRYYYLLALILPFISMVLVDSASFKVTIIVLFVALLAMSLVKKAFTSRTISVLGAISLCFLMVCILNPKIFNSILEFIGKITNRSSSFTGRQTLWTAAIEKIKQSPWIGYGKSDVNPIPIWGGYYTAHNMYLEVLLYGGILAFIPFILALAVLFVKMFKNHTSTTSIYLSCATIAVLLFGVVEAHMLIYPAFAIFTIMSSVNKIDAQAPLEKPCGSFWTNLKEKNSGKKRTLTKGNNSSDNKNVEGDIINAVGGSDNTDLLAEQQDSSKDKSNKGSDLDKAAIAGERQ